MVLLFCSPEIMPEIPQKFIYRMVLLFCSPEIPQKFIQRMVLLFSNIFYFNHISNTINTIIELNINNRSKISYLSSLIFRKNWDVYKWCFQSPEMVEFPKKFKVQFLKKISRKQCQFTRLKPPEKIIKDIEPYMRLKPMVLCNNQHLISHRRLTLSH